MAKIAKIDTLKPSWRRFETETERDTLQAKKNRTPKSEPVLMRGAQPGTVLRARISAGSPIPASSPSLGDGKEIDDSAC